MAYLGFGLKMPALLCVVIWCMGMARVVGAGGSTSCAVAGCMGVEDMGDAAHDDEGGKAVKSGGGVACTWMSDAGFTASIGAGEAMPDRTGAAGGD
jgi:hypothetical protein